MTIRAILLGLLGAVFIAVVAFFNDHVWVLSAFVGSHLPIFVFGTLILTALAVNPLLGSIRAKWQLRPGELATITLILLVACSIPSFGFLGTFTKAMVMPGNKYVTQLSWQKNNLLDALPSHMLPAEGKNVEGFTNTGMSGGGTLEQPMPVNEVPWRHWVEPLTTWLPILLLFTTAVVCISLIIHRQWSNNERLKYPIAEVANEFIHPDSRKSTILTSVFWTGFLIIFLIRVNNGIALWVPVMDANAKWLSLPMSFSFLAIPAQFPDIAYTDSWSGFFMGSNFYPIIFPTIIGIAFLLATDVSLTVGLAPWLYLAFAMILARGFGIYVAGDGSDYMIGGGGIWQRFGSYFALLMMIIYVGRTYYWTILRRAFGMAGSQRVDGYAVWACRVLLVAVTLLCTIFILMGLPWPIAIATVLLVLLVFVGMTRINCESGMFLNMPRWQPLGVLLGLMGATAMGPQAIMIVALISVLFTAAPMETFMPFFVNGLKICSSQEIRPARAGATGMLTYVVVLAVAVPAVLWATHNFGLERTGPSGGSSRWSTAVLPYYYYDAADGLVTEMKNDSKLTHSKSLSSMGRLKESGSWLKNSGEAHKFLIWAGFGIAGVLTLTALRLRLPWWPLHPMLFAIWGTRLTATVGASFLIGWMIKSAVTNLGGKSSYQTTRKLMFGFIAGDLLAALIFMIIGMAYYKATGKPPANYNFLPIIN
jgi:hypothetical protein